MRKTSLLITVLILCMFFVNCGSNTGITTPTQEHPQTLMTPTSAENTSAPTQTLMTPTSVENTSAPTQTSPPEIGQILYYGYYSRSNNTLSLRDLLELPLPNRDTHKTYEAHAIETDVDQTIYFEYADNKYSFQYICSGLPDFLAPSDRYIDVYAHDGYEIQLEHATKKIIYLVLYNCEWINVNNTYDDYINIMASIIGEEFDIAQYDVNITTSHKIDGKTQSVPGYHEIREGVDVEYKFVLRQYINGIGNWKKYIFYFDTNRGGIHYMFRSNTECYDGSFIPSEYEISFANSLVVDKFINDYKVYSDYYYKESTFDSVMIYNKRTYLVFEVLYEWPGFGVWGEDDYEDNYIIERPVDSVYIYVDYERLQQKMALKS